LPFYPGVQRIINALRRGDFGKIIEVETGLLHSSDLNPEKPINWKRMVDINGEYGCLGDLGMHVLHVPLRLGWKPASVYAQLSNLMPERPDGKGGQTLCETWDNATMHCWVENNGSAFPMTCKTWRIAPGETNSWYLKVLGTKRSYMFSTKNPRQLMRMLYTAGGPQEWQIEDLGYESLFPTISGSIFEFGFTDAIQQMWAAYLDELGGGEAHGFSCARPEEAYWHHCILTAALKSHAENQVVQVTYVDQGAAYEAV